MSNEQSAESAALAGQEDDNELLEPFYEELLKLSFPDSVTAIEHCRHLCAQYGFTVKREASTHRNIYVYCSREGKPDSVRNPKGNPKRKRPSKRCDCRWCVVLFERDGQWEFRKSLNPDAARHNHPLMRPEEIDSNWPQDMIDFIYQLARTQLSTADIRAKVQARYPHVAWKERRFYNRLSEERQRFRQQEATDRVRRLTTLWSRVCMAAAGNDELTRCVEGQLGELLQTTCQMAKLSPAALHDAIVQGEPQQQHDDTDSEQPMASAAQQQQQETAGESSSGGGAAAPRGFIRVTIPQQTYFVKVHSHRAANEIQMSVNKRESPTSPDPPRKMSKPIMPTVSQDPSCTPPVLHTAASSTPPFIYPLTPHVPQAPAAANAPQAYPHQHPPPFPTTYIPQHQQHPHQQPPHAYAAFLDHHPHRAGAILPPPQPHPDTDLMMHHPALDASAPAMVHQAGPPGTDGRDDQGRGAAYAMFASTRPAPDALLMQQQQQQQHHRLYDPHAPPSTPMPQPPHHHHHQHHSQP